MAFSDHYRSQLKSARSRAQSARSARERKRGSLRSSEKQLGPLEQKVRRARSESQQKGLERQVDGKRRTVERDRDALDRAERDLLKAEEKVSELEQKLQKQEEIERKDAYRKAKQAAQRRKQRERFDEMRRDREVQQAERERAAKEIAQDQEILYLHDRASELEKKLLEKEKEDAPPEVTVLFLASSPQDETQLRLDRETREIQKRMRTSGFPESIFIEWRLARQLPDLVQDLNEVRPNVLHFSGHGNDSALAFENEAEDAVPLDNEQLGKLLAAAPGRIRLVLFNSCNSASQAKLATAHVDVAVGMDASVDDRVAQTFAGQFYNSLGFGLSVSQAFDQAVLQVEMEHGEGHDIPKLFAAEGVDPATVVLVNPENQLADTG
jgi:hypothetical protein